MFVSISKQKKHRFYKSAVTSNKINKLLHPLCLDNILMIFVDPKVIYWITKLLQYVVLINIMFNFNLLSRCKIYVQLLKINL